MARGFESKDVEYQQLESERPRTIAPSVTREQREAIERRRSLELSLARAEGDLRSATSSPHRRMLEQAIAGESIGITHKGRIIKLQPVPVTEDWAAEEYGLTSEELDRAASNLLRTGEDLLKSGKTVAWDGFKKGKRK
jgi:hypothetical protein